MKAVDGTYIEIQQTSLEDFTLLGNQKLVLHYTTNYGHESTLYYKLVVTDDTCIE